MIHLFLCRYLQKDKVHGPEGNTIYYELAERASAGPIHDKVKEYISQVLFWKVKYASFVFLVENYASFVASLLFFFIFIGLNVDV
jgi:hypothetical protein